MAATDKKGKPSAQNGDAATRSKLKLLVPTNFTHNSELSLNFALIYSQSFNADIYLLHVLEGRSSNYREIDRLNEENMDRMRKQVLAAIARLHAQGISHTVEDVHRRVSLGNVAWEILKVAAGISADMVIMGSTAKRTMRPLVEKAPCTLVMMRDKDPTFVVT